MSAPGLACAVLSLGDEPGLVAAVRSLAVQSEPAEIVVVNSGGGDPGARLAAAGLDVPVVNRRERLYPGAARNIGIGRTRARYVSFLAADCIALPGWAAGRLREHRAGAAAVASCPANANPDSLSAWASLLLLHNRLLPVGTPDSRLFYGLSYERSLFERFGLFDEDLRAGEDTEFNARFRGEALVVRAADVRTAHRYPTSPASFLRDAYRRGRLQAAMLGRIERTRPQGARVAGRAAFNVLSSIRAALQMPEADRTRLLEAWPLVPLGGIAYAVGALTAYFRRYDGYRPPSELVLRSHSAAGK